MQWPDQGLIRELSDGFPLLGAISPGAGWPKRTDGRYSSPMSLEDFKEANLQYTQNLGSTLIN